MTTIDKKEIEKFSKLASDWWNPNGKFKPLHLFNPTRVEFIKDKIISHYKINKKLDEPLKKIKILDIGCGGGLLCEPMRRMGADVTGIDASLNNIKAAKLHAREMGLDIKYIHSSPENLNIKNKFDVILNMEVVEHVSNLNLFIQNCSSLIEKKGIMFVATINRNLKSYIFAILGAEYVLRWLPIGTHDWEKFLTPQELEVIAKKSSFYLNELNGMSYNLIKKKWIQNNDTSVNYIATFLKN